VLFYRFCDFDLILRTTTTIKTIKTTLAKEDDENENENARVVGNVFVSTVFCIFCF
jgi:hypothetical protein